MNDVDIKVSQLSFPTEIAGIDVAQALKRVAGNEALLERILKRFAEEHVNDIKNLRAATNNHNQALARRIIHTLKGVSGNIAAYRLYSNIESLSETPDSAELNDLEDLLSEVVSGIKKTFTKY